MFLLKRSTRGLASSALKFRLNVPSSTFRFDQTVQRVVYTLYCNRIPSNVLRDMDGKASVFNTLSVLFNVSTKMKYLLYARV